MAKLGKLSYTLASLASICFVSGLLVLTGGDEPHGTSRESNIYDKQHA
jgi:hypothetical protein